MVKTQLWSPSSCQCVFEQLVDDSVEPAVLSLYFVHNVCPTHEPLVVNKPKLNKQTLDSKRDEVMQRVVTQLSNNRVRNLQQLDNSQKKKRDIIKEMKKEARMEIHALRMEAKLDVERGNIERGLDAWEDEMKLQFFEGIFSTYAFNAQEVYDKVLEEQRLANG